MFELDIYVIVNFFFKETVFHYKKKVSTDIGQKVH